MQREDAAARAARTTHGGYGAESQAALRRNDALIAETRALLALLCQGHRPTNPPATNRLSQPDAGTPAQQPTRREARPHTT